MRKKKLLSIIMSVIMILSMVPSIAFAANGQYSVRAYAIGADGKIDTSDKGYVLLENILDDGKDRPTADEMLAALKDARAVDDSVTVDQLSFEFYNGDDGNIKKINKGTATVYGFTKASLKLSYIACAYSVDETEPVEQSVSFKVYVDAWRAINERHEETVTPVEITKTFTDGETYKDLLPTDEEILKAAGAVNGQTIDYESPWFGDNAWEDYLEAKWDTASTMPGFTLTNTAKAGGSLNINVTLTDLVTKSVTYYLVDSEELGDDGDRSNTAKAEVYEGETLPDAAKLFEGKIDENDDKVYSWITNKVWADMGTNRTLNDVKTADKVDAADADSIAYVAVLEKRGNIDGAAVSFDVNGGSAITGNFDNVKVGDSITLPTTTRDGWTFLGWYVDGVKVGEANDTYTVNEAADFTAQWKGDVTFNIWEYSDVDDTFNDDAKLASVKLEVNTVNGIPAVDEVISKLWGASVEIGRDDKVYGWYTTDTAKEIAGRTKDIDEYDAIRKASEIETGYANAFVVRDASAEYVTLTLEPNGGSFDGATIENREIKVVAGRALTTEELITPQGMPTNYDTLYGWFDADDNQVKAGDSIDADTTLYAKYSKNVSLVLYDLNNVNSNISQTKVANVVRDEEIGDMTSVFDDDTATLKVEANDEVYGWYTPTVWDSIKNSGADDIKAAAVVKTANADDNSKYYVAVVDKDAKADKYTVSFDSNGGTAREPIEVVSGKSLTADQLAAPTVPTGWTFDGWYDEDGTKYTATTAVEADVTLTAKYVKDNINLFIFDSTDLGVNKQLDVVNNVRVTKGEALPTVEDTFAESEKVTITDYDDVYQWYDKTTWEDNYTDLASLLAADTVSQPDGSIDYYVAVIVKDATAPRVTASYDFNGGVTKDNNLPKWDPITVVSGTKALLPELTNNGWTFAGWQDDKGNIVPEDAVITEDTTYTAQWEKSVTYYLFDSTDINNELDKIEDNKITKGETLPAADEIFKDYITDVDSFTDGWYKSGDWGPSYTEKTPVTTADDNGNTYVAVVTKNANAERATVTFDVNGGTMNSSPDSVQVIKGEKIWNDYPNNPELTGWDFDGWYDNAGTKYTVESVINEDVMLTAKWTKNVTFWLSDGKDTNVSTQYDIVKGETIPDMNTVFTAEQIAEAGITATDKIECWYDKTTWETNKSNFTVLLQQDKAGVIDTAADFYVAAIVKDGLADKYTVSFNPANGKAEFSVDVVSGRNLGSVYSEKPELTGWTFAGWYDSDEAEYGDDSIITAPVSLTAKWTRNVTLWVSKDNNTSQTSISYTVVKGQALPKVADVFTDLTAIGGITADDRVECWYGAASWSAGLSDFNELFKLDTVADFDDTTETSYVAAVQTDGKLADCTVTFDSNGGTDVDAQTVKAGKQVTKPADLTKENRTFAGWYLKKQNGGVATTPFDFSQPVTGDITLIAKWNRTVTYWFYKDKVVVNTGKEIVRTFPEDQALPDVAEFPDDFTVDGDYTIHGWYSSKDYNLEQEVSDLNALTPVDLGNYDVYDADPKWGCWVYCIVETDASKVTVSFDNVLYGDSIDPVKTTKDAGIAAVEPENVQDGYKFVEWVNGSDTVDLTTATFSENTTLKAKWAVEVTYNTYSNNDFTTPAAETEWVNIKISNGNGDATKEAPTYGWFTAETWADITAGKDVTLDSATTVNDNMTVTAPTVFYGMAIDNHTVTFKGGAGENVTNLPTSVTVAHGETVAVQVTPTRAGYTFRGWSVDGENVENLSTYQITEDTTFITLWDTETFEVSFISSSQAVTIDSQFVETGKTAAEPTVTLPEGYFISGYYENGDYTVDYNFNTIITEATTIYVKVDIQKFDVTFDAVLDDVADPATQNVEYGNTVTAVNDPTNENNTFVGWKLKDTDDTEIVDLTTYQIKEATDFVAVWARKTVNITFNVSDHAADGQDIVTQIYKGTNVSVPEVTAAAGYKVDSWYDSNKKEVDLSTATFAQDTVLTPKWAVEVTYKVYSNNNFADAETDSEWVAIKLSGEPMQVTKTATHGWYTADAWEQIAAQGEYDYSDFDTVTRVNEPITLYGMNISGYTVTFSAGTGINAKGIPDDQTVEYGQKLAEDVINAVPVRTDISMEFKGWTIDGTTPVDLAEYVVTGDTDFTALWGKKEYTVEFNNPQAIGSFTGSTATVIYGDKVVVPEVEVPEGYELEGWYTSEDYTEGTKFDVNTAITADYTLYARWSAEVTYNLYNSKSTLRPERVMTEFIPLGNQANLGDRANDVTEGFLYGWFNETTWENVVANKIPNFAVNWEQYKLNYGEFEVNEPVSVYGKYAKTFNVTFSAGEVINATNMPVAQDVLEGGYATRPTEAPEKAGYDFVGWNFNFENTKITQDTEIEALWVKTKYTVTFGANGGYFAPGFTSKMTISYGDNYGILPDQTKVMKSGSTLKGWTKDLEAAPVVLVNANTLYDVYEDTTLYAVWDNSKVQVTYVANGGAVTGVASGTEQVDYGTVITREAEKDGLVFEGWYYDAALTDKYEGEPVIEATTLYAKYQAQITFRVYENATRFNTLVEPKIVMVDEFDEIELPAAEELGVAMGSTDEFIGWYTVDTFGDLPLTGTEASFEGNATTEMTLYANVVRHYSITFDSVGGTEIAAQDVRYNGTATEPVAPEKEGNTFLGWYVGEAAVPYDFATSVTGDLVLTAKWNTNIYSVTFKSGVDGVDDVVDYVYHGSLFDTGNLGVPSFSRLGYTQDGWLLDGVKYDETAPVKGDLTLTANWIMNEFTAVIEGTYTFTGSAIEPVVKVTNKTTGSELVSELYTVTYDVDATVADNNARIDYNLGLPVNAGAYTATVSPVEYGGYDACEAVVIKFTVSPADINGDGLTFCVGYDDQAEDYVDYNPDKLFGYNYTGRPIKPDFTIFAEKLGNIELEPEVDYTLEYESDITSAGTKSFTVTGIGNYTGTKELKYVITKVNIDISDYYATITPEYFVFSGEAQQPSVIVKATEETADDEALVFGRDYTVGYIAPEGVELVNGEPVYPGLYTVVIEGLGNYEGQVTTKPQYTIFRKGVTSADITVEIVGGPEFDYAGKAVTPEVIVKDTARNVTLVKDTDYTVEYFNNNGIGEASVKITGINNYDSERTEAFWIVGPKEISEATIAEVEDVIYDGSAQEPELTITDGDYALVKGTDYTVVYSENVDAGQAKATVTGIGKYTGEKEVSFTINARSIENAEITGVEDSYSATGSAIEPTVTVTDDLGNVLVITDDYTVAYENNTAVGTATITVTGTGNYKGSKTITFEIVNSVFYTTGIVKYASGNPVVGGTVTLKGTTKDGITVSRSTTTDSTGRYYFTDLKDGSYTVTYKRSTVTAVLNPGSPK